METKIDLEGMRARAARIQRTLPETAADVLALCAEVADERDARGAAIRGLRAEISERDRDIAHFKSEVDRLRARLLTFGIPDREPTVTISVT